VRRTSLEGAETDGTRDSLTESEPPSDSRKPPAPGRRFWAWSALVYAVVNLPFLLLTLDTYNLNGEVYSGSFLYLGLNPYHAAVNVGQGSLIIPGAGYVILPYNMVAFLAYPSLGFSAIAVSALLKLFGVVAGFFAARIVYEIAVRESAPNPRAIYLAVLFNPFLIFVNAIAGDPDLLVVVCLVLAVFLFRYGWQKPVHVPAVMLGAVAISLTVVGYYFTLLLVPTMLLWVEGRRTQLLALGTVAAALAVFAVPTFLFGLGSASTSSFLGSVQVTGYSFPYFLSGSMARFFGSNQVVFTALAAVASVAVPLLFRHWKVGQGTTFLTVLVVAFALAFRLPFDVYAILAALVPLAFALGPSRRNVTYASLLAYQAFLVPIFLIAEMFNGPGQVSGIYYWLYPDLHQNTILFTVLGGARAASALFFLYLAAAAVTVALLVRRARRTSRSASDTPPWPNPPAFPPAPANRRSYALTIAVAALLVLIPLAVAYAPAAPAAIDDHEQLNSQLFYAYDPASALLYPLPAPAAFSVDASRGTLSVPGSAPPVGLARSVADTSSRVDLTVTVSPLGNVGPFPVWRSNQTELIYSSEPVYTGNATLWVPTANQGASASYGDVPGLNGTSTVYDLEGQDGLEFVEPTAQLAGQLEYFGGQYASSSRAESVLWAASFGPGLASRCFLDQGILYLGVERGTVWTLVDVATDTAPGQWFLAGFSFDPARASVSAFVNNANLTLPFNLPESGNATFYLGVLNFTSGVTGREAWVGNLTGIRATSPVPSGTEHGFYLTTAKQAYPTWVAGSNTVELAYVATPSGGSIEVNGTNLSFAGADSLVIFGKLGASPAALFVECGELYFVRASGGPDLGWVVLGFGVLLPFWIFLWGSREVWVSLHRSRTS